MCRSQEVMEPVDTPVPGARREPSTSHAVRDLSGASSGASKAASGAAPGVTGAASDAVPPVSRISDAFPELVAVLGAANAASGAASEMSGAAREVSGAVQGLPALPAVPDDDVVRQLIARGQAIVFLPGPAVEQAIPPARVP